MDGDLMTPVPAKCATLRLTTGQVLWYPKLSHGSKLHITHVDYQHLNP
jgi:hypothetical protein